MRTRLLAAGLLLLAACGAGNRVPGADNLLRGPAVAFTAPRPGQVLPEGEVRVLLEVLGAAPGTRRLVSLDGGHPQEVLGAASFRFVGLPDGTHVLRAWLLDERERALRGQDAHAVRVFHVRRMDAALHRQDPEGRLHAFAEHADPVLTWAAPWKDVPAGRSVPIDLLVRGCPPPGCRVLLTIDDTVLGPLAQGDLEVTLDPGEYVVRAQLMRRREDASGGEGDWEAVPGALTAVENRLHVR